MLTKAQEKEMLADIVSKLPAGYVRDILTEMRPEVERAIDSDFGFIPFAQIVRNNQEAQVQLTERRAELAKVTEKLGIAEYNHDVLRRELALMGNRAGELAAIAKRSY